MKQVLCLTLFLSIITVSQAQRFRNEPPYYAFRVGGMVTHLTSFKTTDKHFYSGFNLGMELPFGKKWTVSFGYGQSVYKDEQRPYLNSVANWKENLNTIFTDIRYYINKRYKGFYVGTSEGLMLKKIDALVPFENDVLNRQLRIPFTERLNSFALGLSSGYVVSIKKNVLITFEGKLLTLRYDWAYQLGIQVGYKFQ